ncbi:hypothetical protein ES703_54149 [subsurface metagenome]
MLALLGVALVGLAGLAVALMVAATREAEEVPEELPLVVPPEEEEVVEVIDATLRKGWVYWAGLTAWQQVYTRWPNDWPANTDVTLAWEIKNTGNVAAYFQVYMFDPGDWLYLGPGEEMQVLEEFQTPVLPVTPGYQYYRINILGRNIAGVRLGAVWTSEDIEVRYV